MIKIETTEGGLNEADLLCIITLAKKFLEDDYSVRILPDGTIANQSIATLSSDNCQELAREVVEAIMAIKVREISFTKIKQVQSVSPGGSPFIMTYVYFNQVT